MEVFMWMSIDGLSCLCAGWPGDHEATVKISLTTEGLRGAADPAAWGPPQMKTSLAPLHRPARRSIIMAIILSF